MQVYLILANLVVSIGLVIVALYLHRAIDDTQELIKKLSERQKIIFSQHYGKPSALTNAAIYENALKAMRSYKKSQNTETKDVILGSRKDAESVLESFRLVLEKYGIALRDDLYTLAGIPSTYEDSNWGWNDLASAQIERHKLGWKIVLPEASDVSELDVLSKVTILDKDSEEFRRLTVVEDGKDNDGN